jgi:rhodanese-related sulfurtransferase
MSATADGLGTAGPSPAPSPAHGDHDRPDPVAELLAASRRGLRRLGPIDAARAIADDGALLVDIRPEAQRQREGEIPGSIIVDRNVLEWRLAPTAEHRIPEVTGADQLVIVFCSEGYASSLAAASLRQVGLERATDLAGGFLAWDAAGLPTAPFRTLHLVDRTRPG